MRLIDADVAEKIIIEYAYVVGCNRGEYEFANGILKAVCKLEDVPTVEAVPVVRCKNCKYWHKEIGWCEYHSHFWDGDYEFCYPWESNDWKMFEENDFCSNGKLTEQI